MGLRLQQTRFPTSWKLKMSTETKKRIKPALIFIKLGKELGLVAQLVERRLCKAEALGPNPSKSKLICTHRGRLDVEGSRSAGDRRS